MATNISGFDLNLGNLPKNAGNSFQYILVRMLLGGVSFCRGGNKFHQKFDYSSLPAVEQVNSARFAMNEFLASYSVGCKVDKFVEITLGSNRNFHKDILNEFLNFFFHNEKGQHTSAFVFLYRILERFLYAVPLLYASKQLDYYGTFKDMQDLFGCGTGNTKLDGEFGLFKKFLNQGKLVEKLKLDVVQKVKFLSVNGNQSKYYKLTVDRFGSDVLASKDLTSCEIEVKFRDMCEFIRVIRNRFFHLKTGDSAKNISIDEIIDSDEYFSCVNLIVANFLAIIVLESIAKKYQV